MTLKMLTLKMHSRCYLAWSLDLLGLWTRTGLLCIRILYSRILDNGTSAMVSQWGECASSQRGSYSEMTRLLFVGVLDPGNI